MSRQLRKFSRQRDARKVLLDLTKQLPQLQDSVQGLVKALPNGEGEVPKLLEALIEDCQALVRANEVMRETMLRMLIVLSQDSEENIRKVWAEISQQVERDLPV